MAKVDVLKLRDHFNEEYVKFRSACPLAVWRDRNNMRVVELCRILNTHKTNVANWENGYCRPSDKFWDAIVKLMGAKSSAALEEEWDAWMRTKPAGV